VANAAMSILVCRSNRLWTEADQSALEGFKNLSPEISFIVNGVEIKEVETVLGELPKERTSFRTNLKNLLRFQFYSKSHI